MAFRKLVKDLDRILLSGRLHRAHSRYAAARMIELQRSHFDYGFLVQYSKNDRSALNLLCDTYGSDKGESKSTGHPYPWPSHNYADFYNLAFGLRRNDVRLVVECGLGTNNPDLVSSMGVTGRPGASLRVWRDFFLNAQIVGCDIDADVLFEEDRIATYQCDQTSDQSIEAFIAKSGLKDASVDIVIDDGLHEFHAGRKFFETMIPKLRHDGIYIIEDVTRADIALYKAYFAAHHDTYEARFVYLYTPSRPLGGDNNLVCVTKKVA